jgi:hypothetical protein
MILFFDVCVFVYLKHKLTTVFRVRLFAGNEKIPTLLCVFKRKQNSRITPCCYEKLRHAYRAAQLVFLRTGLHKCITIYVAPVSVNASQCDDALTNGAFQTVIMSACAWLVMHVCANYLLVRMYSEVEKFGH